MQVMPKTAEWFAPKGQLKYKGEKHLFDPIVNIQFGTAYLSYLRTQFDYQGLHFLSAYNMGSTNVRKALAKNVIPREYADRVMVRYLKIYEEMRSDLVSRALAALE
jgi:soluble lytic murein transglycosylase